MTFDPSSALIVVDVQNDFADPSGSLYVSGGEHVIAFINSRIHEADEAGATIAYSQDWHPEVTPHFKKDGGIWTVHCLAESWGASFHPDLDVIDGAIHVRKGSGGEDGYSAFGMKDPVSGDHTSTGLADQLVGVQRVVVVGLALDYCVKETAIDAVREGYRSELLADGTKPVNLTPGDASRAIADMVAAGVRIS